MINSRLKSDKLKLTDNKKPLSQSPLEWGVIFAFSTVSLVLIFVGAGKLLNFFFPLSALLIGILLYTRNCILYNGFIWWLWFLSPLIRRLSDFYGSYTEPSPILLAPFLATLVSGMAVISSLPRIFKPENTAYMLVLGSLIYGFSVGFITRPFVTLSIKSLDYFVPVIYSFYIFTKWREYPNLRKNTFRVFLWGVFLMGLYGVIQFAFVPEWDSFWLLRSEFGSGGKPEPFSLNIWSTMQSNRPFGTVMAAGLVLLLVNEDQGFLRMPATIFGFLSFLLARKRTTWISWAIAVLMLGNSLKAKNQIRLILTLLFFSITLYTIIMLSPFSDFLNERFSTFSNLEEDRSATVRQQTFERTIGLALTSFIGSGIGGPSFDSGIISGLLDLGWIGVIPYLAGMFFIFIKIFSINKLFNDSFAIAARSIAFSTVLQLPLGRPHVEVQGMVLWGFLGFALAAVKFQEHNKKDMECLNKSLNCQESELLLS